jgi:hypothetical protein
VDVALLFFRNFYFYFRINEILDQVDVATEIFEPVLNPKGWKQLFQAQILKKKKSLSQCSTPRAGRGINSENLVPWAKFIYSTWASTHFLRISHTHTHTHIHTHRRLRRRAWTQTPFRF